MMAITTVIYNIVHYFIFPEQLGYKVADLPQIVEYFLEPLIAVEEGNLSFESLIDQVQSNKRKVL